MIITGDVYHDRDGNRIVVTRVASDDTWADIRVAPGGLSGAEWRKRQPLTDGKFPFAVWTVAARGAVAWRRRCPDITDAEIAAMAAIDMRGDLAEVVLRAYRAGRDSGDARAAAYMTLLQRYDGQAWDDLAAERDALRAELDRARAEAPT